MWPFSSRKAAAKPAPVFTSKVDLHLHLLWNVDDGARDRDETLAMARSLAAAGYVEAAVTPHIHPQLFTTKAAARNRFAEVEKALQDENIPLRIHIAAEHYFDETFFDLLEGGGIQTYGDNNRYLLVEFPRRYGLPPRLQDHLYSLRKRGLTVVFAHAERYPQVQENPDVLRDYIHAGHPIQLDLGSVVGQYGSEARKASVEMLRRRLVHIAATDMHRASQAELILDDATREVIRIAGEDYARKILETNPAFVLHGKTFDLVYDD